MKKPLILIIIAISLFSCSQRSTVSSFIDLNRSNSVSVFDIFESVDLVLLETTDQSLIKNIRQVIYFNDRYYVLDSDQAILFCFDSNGKYLFKVAQFGQGPEEYLRLEHFNIDPHNNQLLLLEPYGNLLAFDLDGQFLSKTRLPKEVPAYNDVYVTGENRLVFTSLSYNELLFYDRNENSIYDRLFNEDGRKLRDGYFFIIYRIYNHNSDLFFSPPLSNDIINLSDRTVFSWNFGKRTNTKKMIEEVKGFISKSDQENFRPTPQHYYVYDWVGQNKLGNIPLFNFESSRYRFCALQTKQSFTKYIFCDKKTGQSFVFDKTKENICFWYPQFSGESIIMHEKGERRTFDNPDVEKDFIYYNPNIFTKEQQQLYESRRDDDNPFLVKYNFKQ